MLGILFATSFIALTSKKAIEIPFLPITNNTALIFFGFPACHSACPTTLTQLNTLLNSLPPQAIKPNVVFVNIDGSSTLANTQEYAKNFNEYFIGYKPTQAQLASMKQAFGLNIENSELNIKHRARVYLIAKEQGQWFLIKAVNPFEYSIKKLAKDLV